MQKVSVDRATVRFVPPLVWMVIITGLSTSVFSAAQTGAVITPVLHWLLPGADLATLGLVHAAIRKAAHLAVFGVLVLLWHRALGDEPPRVVVAALLITIAFAGLDEIHQLFVTGRTPSVTDVGWDSLGATLALTVRRLVARV